MVQHYLFTKSDNRIPQAVKLDSGFNNYQCGDN